MAEFQTVLAGFEADGGLRRELRKSGRMIITLWLAVSGGSVTRRQVARYTDVSGETLTRDLNRLCSMGYLTRQGQGRAARYVAGPRVIAWGDFSDLVDLQLRDPGAVSGRLMGQDRLFTT